MEKTYNHERHEGKIYQLWEKGGYFKPENNPSGKPFCIIMPPPNANEALHIGHARFITIEDIITRFERMRGKQVLWLPGTDHAGIETQYVFEKKLAEKGKSRFDYDEKTLYRLIWNYVQKYSNVAVEQMKRLGASADWSRKKFTLDPDVVRLVLQTFRQLVKDGLVYRGEKLINFCVRCGTSYSDLEVETQIQKSTLFIINYGSVNIATTRPETIFADVAVAVNPADKRYKKLIGKTATIPIIRQAIPIIQDSRVEQSFGTGAVKITPAHDKLDFEIGKDHNLPIIQIIDEEGKIKKHPRVPKSIQGLPIKKARKETVSLLRKTGALVEEKPYQNLVGVCYRCKTIIEPTLSVQWFLKTKQLAKQAIKAVKEGKTKFVSKKFEKVYINWLQNLEDWNISRQIVWGIKIPVLYKIDDEEKFWVSFIDRKGKLKKGNLGSLRKRGYSYQEIQRGLVSIKASADAEWVVAEEKEKNKKYLPETDTFDTWFSSSQWPFVALKANSKADFDKFYPTDVMNTGYDILKFWVARMMMLGIYATGKIPFKTVLLHGLVRDRYGQKISKSKGNVINPIEMAEKYGTDALRMGLIWGSLIENDIALSEDDIRGQRNFSNKVWNIARFVLSFSGEPKKSKPNKDDKKIIEQLKKTSKKATALMEQFRLSEAAFEIYHFIWHKFADIYLEMSKQRREEAQPILLFLLQESLKLLHPFMPFVTEAIWQKARKEKFKKYFQEKTLIAAKWPQV